MDDEGEADGADSFTRTRFRGLRDALRYPDDLGRLEQLVKTADFMKFHAWGLLCRGSIGSTTICVTNMIDRWLIIGIQRERENEVGSVWWDRDTVRLSQAQPPQYLCPGSVHGK